MSKHHTATFLEANGVKLHYLDQGNEGPAILLLHSLSANSHIFQGLIANGLAQSHRLIIPDLRGRGLSDKVTNGNTLEEDSRDLLALLDHLELESVIICGHSFGGLLGTYFAANYPDRVSQLVLLDAGVEFNPLTPFLLTYSTARLLHKFPSWDTYLEMVRKAPFMDIWDASIMPFLRADVTEQEDGTIAPRTHWIGVTQAAYHIFSVSSRQWRHYFSAVRQPALLIQASAPYAHGQCLLQDDKAIETVALMHDCDHLKVDGNHITMLFGKGAGEIVSAIRQFSRVAKGKAVFA